MKISRHNLTATAASVSTTGKWRITLDWAPVDAGDPEALAGRLQEIAELAYDPETKVWIGRIRENEKIVFEHDGSGNFEAGDLVAIRHYNEYRDGGSDYTALYLAKSFAQTAEGVSEAKEAVRKCAGMLIRKHGDPYHVITVRGNVETSRKRDGKYSPKTEEGVGNLFAEDGFRIVFSAKGTRPSEKLLVLGYDPETRSMWIEIGLPD